MYRIDQSPRAGHLSLGQLKVMSAIERCRTAALGGHVARCEDCAHIQIAYNSCRNRHCPKCQAPVAKDWLAARQAELLPVPYFHVVFTLPAQIADIAYQNKAEIYGILFKAATETLITIAADPKHLGARIGITAVLHTWGSALTHHPHSLGPALTVTTPRTGAAQQRAHQAVLLNQRERAPTWRAGLRLDSPWKALRATIIANLREPFLGIPVEVN